MTISQQALTGVCVVWFMAGYIVAMGLGRRREMEEAKYCRSQASDLMLDLQRKHRLLEQQIRSVDEKDET